jgi:hypothetical protein
VSAGEHGTCEEGQTDAAGRQDGCELTAQVGDLAILLVERAQGELVETAAWIRHVQNAVVGGPF